MFKIGIYGGNAIFRGKAGKGISGTFERFGNLRKQGGEGLSCLRGSIVFATALLLALPVPVELHAQSGGKTPSGLREIDPYGPKVYHFQTGRADLLRDYRGNATMLKALDSLLYIPEIIGQLAGIEIMGFCSPSGSEAYNRALSERRAQSLRTYLWWKHLEVAKKYPIKIVSAGIDHEGYEALEKSGRNLSKTDEYALLQYVSVYLLLTDGTRIHAAASPLKALLELGRLLPPLPAETEKEKPHAHDRTTAASHDNSHSVASAHTGRPVTRIHVKKPEYASSRPTVLSHPRRVIRPVPPRKRHVSAAVKTNLLYDLALLPNLSVETPLGEYWSAAVSGWYSWWDTGNPHYWSHRIRWAGVEVRRWWTGHDHRPLSGHFAGAYVSGGDYDLRIFTNSSDDFGYLSLWSWSAGLTYGYSMELSQHLNLEFGVGAGYFGGNYKAYNRSRCTDCYPYMGKGKQKYWGITSAGVSLVYRIGEKGGRR